MAAANARWPFERLLWALLDWRNIGGAKVQEIAAREGKGAARRYVRRSWHKATARVRTTPSITDRASACAAIARIKAEAAHAAWSRIAASTDFAVLSAHIAVAAKVGHLDHGLSVRQAAEDAGVRAATASASQRRLIAAGWLRRIEVGRGPAATVWRLRSPKIACLDAPDAAAATDAGAELLAGSGSDAFRWGGLWKSALRVWNALRFDEGLTARQLKDRIGGMSAETVRRKLRHLARYGLARRGEGRLWFRLERDLDDVARAVEKLGVGAEQRARHAEERRAYLEDRAALQRRRCLGPRLPGRSGDLGSRPT
jgi:DNA-binding HxlR family transcriptional regulator